MMLQEQYENCGLSFVPNKETVEAIEENERIKSGEIEGKKYSSFEEMWSDLCESGNKTIHS